MLRKLVGGLAALLLFFGPSVALAQTFPIIGDLVYEFNNYTNITATTTTVIKSSGGMLYGFCVNTVGTTSTLTIYDNTAASGTKIGTFTTTAVGCYVLKAGFKNGLTVVTGGTAGDITVLWR